MHLHPARSLLFQILLGILVILHQGNLLAHKGDHHGKPEIEAKIGIDEKLGDTIPLDLTFRDEQGAPVTLRELMHKPTIFTPVFYSCPDVCGFLLSNLSAALNRLPSDPGKDYQVLSVSFDETENHFLAQEKKKFYLSMIEKPFPEEAWKFLTGEKEAILQLMNSVGFRFRREGKNFIHPVALVILAPDGKITRYLYGTEILPFDLKMALLEASEGRTGPTISKILRFCFSYDPKGRKYVFNTLKITGIVTLTFSFFFILFLVWKGRKRPSRKG
jgi:protein SCO1/2